MNHRTFLVVFLLLFFSSLTAEAISDDDVKLREIEESLPYFKKGEDVEDDDLMALIYESKELVDDINSNKREFYSSILGLDDEKVKKDENLKLLKNVLSDSNVDSKLPEIVMMKGNIFFYYPYLGHYMVVALKEINLDKGTAKLVSFIVPKSEVEKYTASTFELISSAYAGNELVDAKSKITTALSDITDKYYSTNEGDSEIASLKAEMIKSVVPVVASLVVIGSTALSSLPIMAAHPALLSGGGIAVVGVLGMLAAGAFLYNGYKIFRHFRAQQSMRSKRYDFLASTCKKEFNHFYNNFMVPNILGYDILSLVGRPYNLTHFKNSLQCPHKTNRSESTISFGEQPQGCSNGCKGLSHEIITTLKKDFEHIDKLSYKRHINTFNHPLISNSANLSSRLENWKPTTPHISTRDVTNIKYDPEYLYYVAAMQNYVPLSEQLTPDELDWSKTIERSSGKLKTILHVRERKLKNYITNKSLPYQLNSNATFLNKGSNENGSNLDINISGDYLHCLEDEYKNNTRLTFSKVRDKFIHFKNRLLGNSKAEYGSLTDFQKTHTNKDAVKRAQISCLNYLSYYQCFNGFKWIMDFAQLCEKERFEHYFRKREVDEV